MARTATQLGWWFRRLNDMFWIIWPSSGRHCKSLSAARSIVFCSLSPHEQHDRWHPVASARNLIDVPRWIKIAAQRACAVWLKPCLSDLCRQNFSEIANSISLPWVISTCGFFRFFLAAQMLSFKVGGGWRPALKETNNFRSKDRGTWHPNFLIMLKHPNSGLYFVAMLDPRVFDTSWLNSMPAYPPSNQPWAPTAKSRRYSTLRMLSWFLLSICSSAQGECMCHGIEAYFISDIDFLLGNRMYKDVFALSRGHWVSPWHFQIRCRSSRRMIPYDEWRMAVMMAIYIRMDVWTYGMRQVHDPS